VKKALYAFWMVLLLGLAVAGCSSPAKTTSAGPGYAQPTVTTNSGTTTQEQPPAKASTQPPAQGHTSATTAHGQPAQGQTASPVQGQNPTQMQPAAIPTPLTVTTNQVQQNSDAIQVDLSIPVIAGLQDSKIQQQLNNQFDQDALSFDNDISTQAAEDIKQAANSGYPFQQYNATTAYKVAYNQNGLLSVTVDYYQYTGGAHGGTERRPYNYDLETGQELSLQDLFKTGVDYKPIINQDVAAQIKTSPVKEYFTIPGMEFKTIDDNQPFYLTDGGLVIYFGQYEIAPYVAGIPEFQIPFSLFKDGVKPRFTGH